MIRRALFPGSFDPFTLGHHSIVQRTLAFMDEVVIAIGVNIHKQTFFPANARLQMIQELYAGDSRVQVITYNALTVDIARELEAPFIVRGVRSISDYEYELHIADINKQVGGMETILLFTEPHLSCISSSAVRELLHYNRDVSPFVPEGLNIEKWK